MNFTYFNRNTGGFAETNLKEVMRLLATNRCHNLLSIKNALENMQPGQYLVAGSFVITAVTGYVHPANVTL